MAHNILITGGSGYLGGTLLARWKEANLPAYNKLFALVRTPEQAEAVKQYGAEPLLFDAYDEAEVRAAVVDNNISIVYHLIAPRPHVSQSYFIKAMAEVKKNTGRDVHFLHTSGAKMFSSHAAAPTDKPLLDNDPKLYEIQKAQKVPVEPMQEALDANNFVIEETEKYGIRGYVFVPCIVSSSTDGKGEGFGSPISIQTVAIVRAAQAVKRVYRVDSDRPTWPVCHVRDNTSFYLELLRKILAGGNPSYGKNGYYLAASGSVAWDDLYTAMAAALAKRNVVTDDSVAMANDQILEAMGEGLGCPGALVPVMLGGKCTFTADRGSKELGWKPFYKPEHILEDADAEVELILHHKNLRVNQPTFVKADES
ncbi:NAD(P)-binding protein [Xylariaceae sp. AK1471]|nr:NAD(P)-binding protein [Xylariaceae sp. AK1471]